jgi:small-conductance mechanosensitive channel
MPSSFNRWFDLAFPNFLHLLGILVIALVLNRLLRAVTKLLVKPATTQTRAAQHREQQTRTLAGVLYGAGSKIVWVVAILTALHEFNIDVTPAVTLAGLASLALGFGAQSLIKDIISGFYIILEDQYVVGDTIQYGDSVGRVEHLTLRRTVIRDVRGALVTIANGEIRTVSNLSRDWSQTFVDVSLSSDLAIEKSLQVLEVAAACATILPGLRLSLMVPAHSAYKISIATLRPSASRFGRLPRGRMRLPANSVAAFNWNFSARVYRFHRSSASN